MESQARWLAAGEHAVPEDQDFLTPAEAGYLASVRFTKRRTEFLLRRWVTKQAVLATLGGPPRPLAGIEVAHHPGGAPYVLVDGERCGLEVSVSDRAGWAVCLVGTDLGRLGCDLEIVEPRSAGFVEDFLTDRERDFVASRASHDWDAAANLLWSAKESGLKVLRTGLRRDTRSVEVAVGDPDPETRGWGALGIEPVEGGRLAGWWRREGVFLLTVASDRPLAPPEPLPGCADLGAAAPVHSWVANPVAD